MQGGASHTRGLEPPAKPHIHDATSRSQSAPYHSPNSALHSQCSSSPLSPCTPPEYPLNLLAQTPSMPPLYLHPSNPQIWVPDARAPGGYVQHPDFPALPPSCPPDYAQLLADCLQLNHTQRPVFDEITQRLKAMACSLVCTRAAGGLRGLRGRSRACYVVC